MMKWGGELDQEMDLELLNQILEKYELDENRDIIYDDLELDEFQKQYLAGYLSGMTRGRGTSVQSDLITEQINQVRSKYCEPILAMLEEEGNLYHGDLAEKLGLSPSGLSAIIKKMQESKIPLIQTSQIGKYKIYSLSDEMKGYINKKAPSESRGTGIKRANVPVNLFLPLQRFAEEGGELWKELLNSLLQGESAGCSESAIEAFYEFMELVTRLPSGNSGELKKIHVFLKNDVLSYLLEEYIKAVLQYRDYLDSMKDSGNYNRDMGIIKWLAD